MYSWQFKITGFGPALRAFDKALLFKWSYKGTDPTIDDFEGAYIAGGPLDRNM